MAKKDKKKAKQDPKQADPVGAVRTAVERTFQATADSAQSTRTRAQDLVDEVAGAAGRVREMIEDIRVLEDLKGLRTEVDALSRRVAALESAPPKKSASGRASSGRASSGRAASGGTTRSRSTGSGRSTAKRKPAATSKTRSSSSKKPAS